GAGGPNGPAARGGGGPPPGGARAGGPRPGGAGAGGPGRPGPGAGNAMVNGTALIAAIDWLEKEAANPASRFHNKVNVESVAAMGRSCGGLMSYGASSEPRVATAGRWHSGPAERAAARDSGGERSA